MKNDANKISKDLRKIFNDVASLSHTEVLGILRNFSKLDMSMPPIDTSIVPNQTDKITSRVKNKIVGRGLRNKTSMLGLFGMFTGGYFTDFAGQYVTLDSTNEYIAMYQKTLDFFTITAQEMEQTPHIRDLAEMFSLNATELHGLIAFTSTMGAIAYTSYNEDQKTRYLEEEKIAKYSDDILKAEGFETTKESINKRKDARYINKLLGKAGSGDGFFAKVLVLAIKSTLYLARLPKKTLNYVSESLLKSKKERNTFDSIIKNTIGLKISENEAIYFKELTKDKSQDEKFIVEKLIENRKYLGKNTRNVQTPLTEDDITVGKNMENSIIASYQEILKRNIKKSLIKAIKIIEQDDGKESTSKLSFLSNKMNPNSVYNAKKIIKNISRVHGMKNEALYDHYQSISQIAMNYKNDNYTRNKNESVEEFVNKMLDKNSFENAKNNLKNTVNELVKNHKFKEKNGEKSKNYFISKITKHITLESENYLSNSKTLSNTIEKTLSEMKRVAEKSMLNPDYEELNMFIENNIAAFSQIKNNQNIQDSIGLWELIEFDKRTKVSVEQSSSILKENAFALSSSLKGKSTSH